MRVHSNTFQDCAKDNMKIFIETDAYLLREIVEDDIEGMFALDSDPQVYKYFGYKPIQTREEALGNIHYIQQQYKDNGIGRWAIIEKSSQEFVGWTGLKYEKEVRDFPYYDIGYRLRTPFWGKGIGYTTALASLKYGFNTMELPKISGGAHIDNAGSNRILSKIGLQLVEQFVYENLPHNWYSCTKSEWENR